MPYRRHPIIPGQIYHIFNRSIARQPIFLSQRDYLRGLDVLNFYSFAKPGIRFSHYNRLSQKDRKTFDDNLRKNHTKQIQILAFCLMPNHIHLLVKGIQNRGIQTLMTNFQHSYAKYFNTKNKRVGSLFQSMFKAIRIETEEQMLHLARYIHLNPFTSYIVRNLNELENYQWSSYIDYLGKRNLDLVNLEMIRSFFPRVNSFKKFTYDQAEYQKKLDEIKHLMIE